ncbi:hypothetical protein ACFFRR_006185 [Megaselia abdita]
MRMNKVVKYCMHESKNQFYKNQIKEANGNIAKIWKFINECTGKTSVNSLKKLKVDETEITDPLAMANEFNNYFVNSANFGGNGQHFTANIYYNETTTISLSTKLPLKKW